MNIGDKVKVIYNGWPIGPRHEMTGTILKITPKGMFRIEAQAKEDVKYNELFYPYHTGDGKFYARGWNTLWWEPLTIEDMEV